MTLNQSSPPSLWLSKAVRSLGKGVTAVALLVGAGALTAGCLDRPVTPATPATTNVYINQIRQTGVDKIDLLFMIDNSISMSDKQQILAQAVPVLVQRLIQPTCVDANGMPTGATAGSTGLCPMGMGQPEFKPIQNIHIGVITSSLGDHGSGDVCSDAQDAANIAGGGGTASNYNDMGELLPSVRPTATPALYSWANNGFLVWDPRVQAMLPTQDRHDPVTMNETDSATFITNFTNQVTAAGEHGCGYEAQLESWYRFLVDPQPVKTMGNNGAVSVRPTVFNDIVLQQRAKFMRPDSLLAVIMLSDENDCSIVDEDGQQGWLVGFKGGVGNLSWHMPRAHAVCATNANDKGCGPCIMNDADPACMGGAADNLTLDEDSMNERCYNQVQRFGINLLYPTSRYVEALSKTAISPRYGQGQVPNPVFANTDGKPPRQPELVFLAGLVGVPWQDVATSDSLMGRGLTYLTAKELNDNGRWDMILGNPGASPPILPSDPFMIESIDPRTMPATNPVTNDPIQPPTSNTPNKINGHEQAVLPQRDDLQFACIFPLGKPVDAATCTAKADACDCNADEFDKHSPLCNGTTADADGSQVSAKGYPGLRELDVLKGMQNQSIVASICPKNIAAAGGATPSTDPDYGYNPAVAAIVNRLKDALTVKCLPRPLSPDTLGSSDPAAADYNPDVGKVPCAVVEVRPEQDDGTCLSCASQQGRSELTGERAKVKPAAVEFLRNEGECDGAAIPCSNECFCELTQFTGPDLTACQTGTDTGTLYGYCYVDPEAATAVANADGTISPAEQTLIDGETALVKDCSATQKRILRFIGSGVPAKDGVAFIACIGANSAQ